MIRYRETRASGEFLNPAPCNAHGRFSGFLGALRGLASLKREQAELYLAAAQVKLARNEMRAPVRVAFADAAEAWHKHRRVMKGWTPSTARDFRSVLDKWLLPSFGSKQLDTLTAAALMTWRQSRMEAGEMPRRTAGKVVSVLLAVVAAPARRGKPRRAWWRELPAAEMAAHLLRTPTIADRAWTDEPRLPRETRTAFIHRVLLGNTEPIQVPGR